MFPAPIRGLIPRVKIITDGRCTGYARAGHPENPRRVAATVAHLQSQTELPLAWVAPGENVSDEIILRAHAPRVLARLAVPTDLDDDTPYFENISSYARASVAASLDAETVAAAVSQPPQQQRQQLQQAQRKESADEMGRILEEALAIDHNTRRLAADLLPEIAAMTS